MNTARPELDLERLLLALEHEVMDASDEELLSVAQELGMNPTMKGSSAFFGILNRPLGDVPRKKTYIGGRKPVTREQVEAWLAMLSPQEAEALRFRFGMDLPGQNAEDEDVALRALARELAIMQKKP